MAERRGADSSTVLPPRSPRAWSSASARRDAVPAPRASRH